MRPTDELPVIFADQIRSLNYDGPDGGEIFADTGTLLDLATGTITSTGLVVDGTTGDVAVRGDITATSLELQVDGITRATYSELTPRGFTGHGFTYVSADWLDGDTETYLSLAGANIGGTPSGDYAAFDVAVRGPSGTGSYIYADVSGSFATSAIGNYGSTAGRGAYLDTSYSATSDNAYVGLISSGSAGFYMIRLYSDGTLNKIEHAVPSGGTHDFLVNGTTRLSIGASSASLFGLTYSASLVGGLAFSAGDSPPSGRQIVTSHTNGYLYAGWINTVSGSTTSTISRIYASNDAFIRYVTPETFRAQVASFIAPCDPIDREYDNSSTKTAGTWYTVTLSSTVGGVAMSGAKGVFANITIVAASGAGALEVRAFGGTTNGSWSNYDTGLVPVANQGFIGLDSSRRFQFRPTAANIGRVIVDVYAVVF